MIVTLKNTEIWIYLYVKWKNLHKKVRELSHVGKSRGVKYFRCLLVDVQYSRRVFQEGEKKRVRDDRIKKAELPGFSLPYRMQIWKIRAPTIRRIYIRGVSVPPCEPYRIYSKSRMHMFPSRTNNGNLTLFVPFFSFR